MSLAFFRDPTLPPRNWVDLAACAGLDTDAWFIEDKAGSYLQAKEICFGCPVRLECLDWAITTGTDHGLWGGLAPLERKRLRKRRND